MNARENALRLIRFDRLSGKPIVPVAKPHPGREDVKWASGSTGETGHRSQVE